MSSAWCKYENHAWEEVLPAEPAYAEGYQTWRCRICDYHRSNLAPVADNVNHPSHYTWLGGIEVIDITEHMGFCLGNVVKYVLRADHKGEPIQDLEKAAWYLAREIENRKKRLT